MRSRNIYKCSGELGKSPLISPSQEREEELARVSSRSAISLIRQHIPQLPPPPMPSAASLPSPTTPPPPTPQFSMVSVIKLPIFRGVGKEDPDQFWFVLRWEAQGVTDDNIKKATLVNMLQDRALTWHIKHSNDHPNVEIVEM